MTVNKFHTAAVKETLPIILCSLKILYRYWRLYKSTGASSEVDNDGNIVGKTKLLADSDLHKLNSSLDTVGFVDGTVGLQNSMMDSVEKASALRGITAFHNVTARTALDRYHAKAALLD